MSRLTTLSRGHRSVAAFAVACLAVSGVAVGIRASYGAFDDTERVTGMFPRAGQSLKLGSDVLYRGVPVGEVRGIDLVGQQVRITLALEPDRRVPDDVEAVVAPKTLFGEKSVELRGGRSKGGPYLEDGSKLTKTRTGAEVEDLIAAAEPILSGIDTTELAGLMTELTQTLQGEGRNINRTIEPTVAAAGLLEDTLDAQYRLLDSSARFAKEIRDIGPGLNDSAENLNLLLPTLNEAREDYVRLLTTLRPLADNLSEILVTIRPDLDRLLVNGGNIVRVLITREDELAETINGLAVYFQTFSQIVSPETFEDGSKGVFFKAFMMLDDIRAVLCAVVNPGIPLPEEALAVLDTVSSALLEESGLLDCGAPGDDAASAAADVVNPALDPDGAPVAAPTGGPSPAGTPSLDDAAQPYYAAAAAPDASDAVGVSAIVDSALGGAP